MKQVYIILIGLLIGLSSSFDAQGQIYEKTNGTGWDTYTETGNKDFPDWELNEDFNGENGLFVKSDKPSGNSVNRNSEHWAFSPAIELKDVSNLLIFEDRKGGWDNQKDEEGSTFSVLIAPADAGTDADDLDSYVNVESWTGLQEEFKEQRIDLSDWSGQEVRLAFLRTNEAGASWAIKNLKVFGADLPEVENFKVSSIDESSISLKWDENSDYSYFLVGSTAGEIDFIPQDGETYNVDNVEGASDVEYLTETTYLDDGLNSFTSKFYSLWLYDDSDDSYSLLGKKTKATTFGDGMIFYEDFEDLSYDGTQWAQDGNWTDDTTEPINWNVSGNGDHDSWLPSGASTSYRGDNSAYIVEEHDFTEPIYKQYNAYSPTLTTTISIPDKYESAELSFFWKAGGKLGSDYAEVFINDGDGDKRVTTVEGLAEQLTWKQELIDISEFVGKDITLKFRWHNSGSYTSVHEPSFAVDDVMINGKTVKRPKAFSATVVNNNTVSLNWTKNSDNNDIMVAYSSSGYFGTLNDGTSYDVGNELAGGGEIIYKGSETSFNHDINSGNRAYYRIWSVSDGDGNAYSTARSASTVLPVSLPFTDGFEGDFIWNVQPSDNNSWYKGKAVKKSGEYSAYVSKNGGFTPEFDNSHSSSAAVLEIPLNLAGFDRINLDFWYKITGGENNQSWGYVELENENGATTLNDANYGSQSEWKEEEILDIDDSEFFSSSSRLKFKMEFSDAGDESLGFSVDDVYIRGDLNPVQSAVATNSGGLKNTIDWENADDSDVLEVVVVAFTGVDDPDHLSDNHELDAGTKYMEGDMVGDGRIVYIGSEKPHVHDPVQGGQDYTYLVFQKNGLTYSEGKVTNTVTTPESVTFFEDFEDGTNGWDLNTKGSNSWKIGTPDNHPNVGNVAFITNDDENASYAGVEKGDDVEITLTKDITFEIPSSGANLEFDYGVRVNSGRNGRNAFTDEASFSITSDDFDNESVTFEKTDETWDRKSIPLENFTETDVTATLTFKLLINEGSEEEKLGFVIDNIAVVGAYDKDSKVVDPESDSDGGELSSVEDTESEALDAFEFGIEDQGGTEGDDKETNVHQLTIVPDDTGNDIDSWSEVLGGATLYKKLENGETEFVASGIVRNQSIVFEEENMISVENGGTDNFVMKVWASETLESSVDNGSMKFKLNSSDVVAYNGSSLKESNTSASSEAVNLTIDATELRFSQQPSSNGNKNTVLSQQPIVVATDKNGNVDADFDDSNGNEVTLSAENMTGATGTPASGVTEFSGIEFTSAGVYNITATSENDGLTDAVSDDITIDDTEGETLTGDSYIGAFRLAEIDSYTGDRGTDGYELFTDQVAYVTLGVEYKLENLVTVTDDDAPLDLSVLVDYEDGNGFQSEFSKTNIQAGDDQVFSKENFKIENQDPGTYRLRVKLTNDDGTVGEIEDYTVVINEVQWTGMSPGWDVRDNWSNRVIPANPDKVFIPGEPSKGSFFPVVEEDRTVSELNIEKGAKLTIKPGGSFTVDNDNGDIKNEGEIVLESTSDKLSSLMLPKGATKAGLVNVKLLVPGDSYWYLSHPIQDAKSTIYSDFSDMETERLWVYRHIDGYNPGWFRVNREVSFLDMEGAHMIYEGADKQLDYSGSLNTGEQKRTFDNTGWHLFGNPYPTAIDWKKDDGNGWSRTGISGTIYNRIDMGNDIDLIYAYNRGEDGFVSQFEPEDIGYTDETISYIAPFQAVWIKVNQSGSTLQVDEAARVNDNSMSLKSGSSSGDKERNLIRIKTENAHLFDATVLYFNEEFIDAIGNEDVEKRFNNSDKVPEVFTQSGNKALAINGLPELTEEQYSFSFSVRNQIEDDVTLSVSLDEFESGYDVFLEDTKKGQWIDLRSMSEYTYKPVKKGDSHDRFVLHLIKEKKVPTNVEDTLKEENIIITSQKGYAIVYVSNELLQGSSAQIDVLDMHGRLMNRLSSNQTETKVDLPDNSGVYIIRVSAGGEVKTEKVFRTVGN